VSVCESERERERAKSTQYSVLIWCADGFVDPATRIKQQRLHAWTPILTPGTTIPVFVFLALVFFAIGVIWVSFTYAVVVESKTYRYDNVCAFNSKCTFRFRIEEDMTEPV
jgi:hypothetical protein